MSSRFQNALKKLCHPENHALLLDIKRGIERETLRVSSNGKISMAPHPQALGASLSNSFITTDFSEALLEFVTPPLTSIDDSVNALENIHSFTHARLNDELLWSCSMPCQLPEEDDIPIAQYGSSNIATMKTVYRQGLSYRYSRSMQTIAGIHYNFSLPESFWLLKHDKVTTNSITAHYFDLIRNFQRYSWLLIYLFGASPAVEKSFVSLQNHSLEIFGEDQDTLHLPFATSLRMGDLGYQSNAQKNLNICYNQLDSYILSLRNAITQPHQKYVEIGTGTGRDRRQLNTSLLQIENEFYSSIRPKRVTKSGQTPLGALQDEGIEYIEVRCIDIDPYEPNGISNSQLHFLDAFLLFCALEDSPQCNDTESEQISNNIRKVVNEGRRPNIMLSNNGKEVTLSDWATTLLEKIGDVAAVLDEALDSNSHTNSTKKQIEKVKTPELTPSASMLRDLKESDIPFFNFALQKSQDHSAHFSEKSLSNDWQKRLDLEVEQSIQKQKNIEASDELGFEEYLRNYYKQYEQLLSTTT